MMSIMRSIKVRSQSAYRADSNKKISLRRMKKNDEKFRSIIARKNEEHGGKG
jgi:hypothetical protein